jgi:hypothetical protein
MAALAEGKVLQLQMASLRITQRLQGQAKEELQTETMARSVASTDAL